MEKIMSLKNLIKIANYYDVKYGFKSSNLYKISTPLNYIDYSEAYQKFYGAPETVAFKDFLGKTKHKYNLIFSKENVNLPNRPISIDKAKEIIDKEIKSIKNNKYEDQSAYLENYEYLKSQKFDEDAINVIISFFNQGTDYRHVEAVVHDICHVMMERDILKLYDKLNELKTDNSFFSKIKKDYNIYKYYNRSNKEQIEWDELLSTAEVEIIKGVIESSVLLKSTNENFISYYIFSRGKLLSDATADFLTLFLKEGTFDNVEIKGVEFISLDYHRDFENSPHYRYLTIPKDENIPNVKEPIKEILTKIEDILKTRLDSMVGKVLNSFGA